MFPLTCQCEGVGWVAADHRVVMDTLRIWLGLIRGLTLPFRHHSPSLSIVDEFKHWLPVFPFLALVACFPVLGAGCLFYQAYIVLLVLDFP